MRVARYIILHILCLALSQSCCTRTPKEVLVYVQNMAKDFSTNYIQDYISIAETYKIVNSDGVPIQFMAQTALLGSFNFNQNTKTVYYLDKGQPVYSALDSYVSDIFIPNSNEKISAMSLISNNNDINSVIFDYTVDLDQNMLLRKRGVEIYGPLNPIMIKKYHYRIEYKDDELVIIAYKSKGNHFSKLMRINGSGHLYINPHNGRIRKITCDNLEDRYSSYIYYNDVNRMKDITANSFEITYTTDLGGIVAQELTQEIKWMKPMRITQDDGYYVPEIPPYKTPYKYNLSSICKMCLCEPLLYTDTAKNYLNKKTTYGLSYIKNIDFDYWHKKLAQIDEIANFCEQHGGYIEIDKQAEKMNNLLLEQAGYIYMENSKALSLNDAEIKRIKDNYILLSDRTREVFQTIYSKEYNQ